MSGARPEGKAAELFADLPELETERLLLRKMRLSDAEAMFSYASDPEVTRHVLWETHGSMVESENFLRFAGEGYERGDFGGWGVVLKASGPSWEPAAWRPPRTFARRARVRAGT